MISDLSPLEAYIASQVSRDGIQASWIPAAESWVKSHLNDPRVGQYRVNSLARLYSSAIGKPGRDYRLGWLPKLGNLLPHLPGHSPREGMFEAVSDFHSSVANNGYAKQLFMLAPLSAEEIQARGDRLLSLSRFDDADILHGLLANPNAPAGWLESLYDLFVSKITSSNWSAYYSPTSLVAILRNPSLTPKFAARALEELMGVNSWLVNASEDALVALIWNPALPEAAIQKIFSGGMTQEGTSSLMRTTFPWRGNLKSDSLRPSAKFQPVNFSREQVAAVREAYLDNHSAWTWATGIHPEKKHQNVPLSHYFTQAHTPDPDTFMRSLDRFHLDPELEGVRSEVFNFLAPNGGGRSAHETFFLNFYANRLRLTSELVASFNGAADEIPVEWLNELL